MISLKNITKNYANGKVSAVSNLNLEVQKGEIFGFIGPNGAGKTTTIKMITGILRPTEGSIVVNGVDMLTEPVKAKSQIGYVPDTHDIFDRLTGQEYLSFIADIYGVSPADRKIRAEKYLNMFEIASAAGELIRTYSHGMRQKLLLTGALIHNPPLWILDEPMVGLDPKAALLLKEAMRSHCKEGNTVFFSTHVLEVAEKLCNRIGIISGGKLAAVGTMEALRQNPDGTSNTGESLEDLFFQLTDKQEG